MNDDKRIYLDYNSTTPVDPQVLDVMIPFLTNKYGNAASRTHSYGWEASESVERAREQISSLINAGEDEIIFTSGATESVNLAMKGVFEAYAKKGNHIITCNTEHKAVLDTCRKIEKSGGEITYLEVDSEGLVHLDMLEKAIRPDTVLVSIMWANNETGIIQPMEKIGQICEKKDVLLFSDATQALGKIKVHPRDSGVHILAASAHKLYGPKGVGMLYMSRKDPRVKVIGQLDGGGHEKGIRAGTLNVPGIVGFGEAVNLCGKLMKSESKRLAHLRHKLESSLTSELEAVYINGKTDQRLPHVSNLAFLYLEAEELLMSLNRQIAVATGSACTSASLEPSHVLMAMGKNKNQAQSSIRFSLGRYTKEEEIEYVIDAFKNGVNRLRSQSPIWEMYKEGVDLD